jgi:hypothetical protein
MSDVKVLVGFASEFKDAPHALDRDAHKMVPIYVFPDHETAFVTMAISRELLDTADERAKTAEIVADSVAAKIKKLILAGPEAGFVG